MLKDDERHVYNELIRAAKNDDLALVECIDVETNEPVAVLCLVNHDANTYDFLPVAQLVSNPYERFIPPCI
jgi:hypothetical protein